MGRTLYVLGGEKVPRTPVDAKVYCLNLDEPKPQWKVLETSGDEPEPSVAHAQALVTSDAGTQLWVFGGRQGILMEEKPLQSLHCLDLGSGRWEKVEAAKGNPPCARSFHRMVAVGQKLFVFAGCGAEVSGAVVMNLCCVVL